MIELSVIKDNRSDDWRLLLNGYILGSEHFSSYEEAEEEASTLIRTLPNIYTRGF